MHAFLLSSILNSIFSTKKEGWGLSRDPRPAVCPTGNTAGAVGEGLEDRGSPAGRQALGVGWLMRPV